MHDPQKHWLQKLRKLHPYVQHAKGEGAAKFAPHKPLLLLALLDLAESSGVQAMTPAVSLTAGLRLRFNESWSVVVARWRTKPDVRLPFYHLSSQGFWKPLRADGSPATDPDSTAAIELHPELASMIALPSFRDLARHVLIQTWFPDYEQVGLYAMLGMKTDGGVAARVVEEEAVLYERTGRDARFRVQVVTQYLYTCALTGYTLTTTRGATMVVAAHIADFASNRDNDPRNGLALTPDAHWSFDEHLWTVDEKLRVVVAQHAFTDWSPEGQSLTRLHGRPLFFHARATLRPHDEYLAKHRAEFVG